MQEARDNDESFCSYYKFGGLHSDSLPLSSLFSSLLFPLACPCCTRTRSPLLSSLSPLPLPLTSPFNGCLLSSLLFNTYSFFSLHFFIHLLIISSFSTLHSTINTAHRHTKKWHHHLLLLHSFPHQKRPHPLWLTAPSSQQRSPPPQKSPLPPSASSPEESPPVEPLPSPTPPRYVRSLIFAFLRRYTSHKRSAYLQLSCHD